ncbi:hypothetical protein FB45DRAFT_1053343 [Roridomyces roridus]|uniref:F-box domain-containing protein n=1 Tax=Roridomyces roridus TaxID=1738132 RepID=A0AAD7CE61_9AGAR|nr:hypothetical protein FB45DRAFT_1053343 [Roridomyces roridus]
MDSIRDQERDLLAALRPLIAPIRKLPVELLTEVFLLLVDSTGDWLLSALLVSQICAHWRRVACATPQLWDRLITLDRTKSRSAAYMATTKTLFERSAPLSVPISLKNESRKASPLAEYIYSLAPRWKSLSWSGSSSRLRALPLGSLNSLESVNLSHCTDVTSSSPIDVFLGAQRLRIATFSLGAMGLFQLPWSQLTSLGVTELMQPAQVFLDILFQCTNVVDVAFSAMIPWTEAPALSTPVIQLPHLQQLTLIFAPGAGENITPFFSRLSLPALIVLNIMHADADMTAWWSTKDFTQFQRRSPHVHELSVFGTSLTSEGAVSLLTEYPHLTWIDLRYCFHTEDALNSVLDLLGRKDTQPRLRRLAIVHHAINTAHEAVLEQIIFPRWWPDAQSVNHTGARLERLDISRGEDLLHQFSAPFVAKVDQLRAQGLKVVL